MRRGCGTTTWSERGGVPWWTRGGRQVSPLPGEKGNGVMVTGAGTKVSTPMSDFFLFLNVGGTPPPLFPFLSETGGVLLAPRPAPDNHTPKPGFPMRPFYGIQPLLVDDKVRERKCTGKSCRPGQALSSKVTPCLCLLLPPPPLSPLSSTLSLVPPSPSLPPPPLSPLPPPTREMR